MEKNEQTRLNALTQEVARLKQLVERSKLDEAGLIQREQHYRTIFDNASIGLAQVGPDGRFIEVNRQFCRVLGYSRTELLDLTYRDITHPEDCDKDLKVRQQLLSGERSSAVLEKRYVCKDGTAIWVRLNLSATYVPGFPHPNILTSIENITDYHALRESLGCIATNLAEAKGIALGGAWEWNIEKDEIHTSPEVLHLLALPPNHSPPGLESALSRVHPDDKAAVERVLQEALADDKPHQIECRLLDPDGAERIVSVTGKVYRRNDKGEPEIMIGMVQDISMRKQAEQAIKESEQRFRSLFDDAADGIFIADSDGRYIDMNLSACSMLGYSREELIGKCIADLIPEKDVARVTSAKKYFLQNPEHVRLEEWELKHKDGRYIQVEVSARILPDGRWMAIVRDIGERRHTQHELERYAAEVQDLYDQAPCGYHSVNRDGLIIRMNRTELEWLGYESDEVIGKKKITDLMTPASRATMQVNFPRLLETGLMRDVELEMVRKNGSVLPVMLNASGVYDEDGNFVRSRSTLFDMTELVEAQKKLRQAAAVFEHTNDAILITDSAGTIVAVNNAFTRITGYTPEEVIGKTPRLLKSDMHDEQFYRDMWQTLDATGTWQGEIHDRRKSGEFFPVWECITAVRDESGNVSDYISVFSDITTIKDTENKLMRLAYHDALTGLPNRLLFNDRVEQMLARAKRHGSRVALLLLDLDRFKLINDTLGHAAGDELLQVIATRLQQSIRKEDTVARLGGDEFAIVSAQAEPLADAALLAQKVVSLIAQPVVIAGQALTISASVGIGMFPEDASDPATLAKCADMAMYGAKQSGRNAYAFYTAKMTDTAFETLAIDRGLRDAIANGELELFYQPQIELGSGKIVGIEALIRWHRPQQGLESPAKFIPVAEESDLIDAIGNWVFDEACARLHHWHSAGLPPMRLAINLSARQLRNPRFVESIRQRLEKLICADGFYLELEITETALQTAPNIVDALNELKSLGLQIAIDDFGTGYSSLNSLKHLPVDVLKIDRSFIHGIPEDADDKAIASAIIAMGHNLGMRVIAEGIETEEQLQFLIGQQCDEAQGFLVHPPLRAEECERVLAGGGQVQLPVQARAARSQGRLH